MPWSRRFDDPAAYILALPKSKQQSPEWQEAGEAVTQIVPQGTKACDGTVKP
jgi:hypothetical protein